MTKFDKNILFLITLTQTSTLRTTIIMLQENHTFLILLKDKVDNGQAPPTSTQNPRKTQRVCDMDILGTYQDLHQRQHLAS